MTLKKRDEPMAMYYTPEGGRRRYWLGTAPRWLAERIAVNQRAADPQARFELEPVDTEANFCHGEKGEE